MQLCRCVLVLFNTRPTTQLVCGNASHVGPVVRQPAGFADYDNGSFIAAANRSQSNLIESHQPTADSLHDDMFNALCRA